MTIPSPLFLEDTLLKTPLKTVKTELKNMEDGWQRPTVNTAAAAIKVMNENTCNDCRKDIVQHPTMMYKMLQNNSQDVFVNMDWSQSVWRRCKTTFSWLPLWGGSGVVGRGGWGGCYGLTLTALTLTASATKIYLICTTMWKQWRKRQEQASWNTIECVRIRVHQPDKPKRTTKHDNQNSRTREGWPYVLHWVRKLWSGEIWSNSRKKAS